MPQAADRVPAVWTLAAAALAYAAWVVYGSLFPLAGWRDDGLSPLLFLFAGLPRYWTLFDLASNVLLYLPLGFLGFRLGRRRLGRWLALAAAVGGAAALSFGVEVVQHWLPSRVQSNLDLLCNGAGAVAGGGLAWRYEAGWRDAWQDIRRRVLRPAGGVEAGVALLAVWALVQLSPSHVLFGSSLVGVAGAGWLPLVEPGRRIETEALAVAAHLLAVALLAAHVFTGQRPRLLAWILFGGLAVAAAKAVVAAFALGFANAFEWLSAGAQWGAVAGALAVAAAIALPPRWRLVVALAALLVGSAALLTLPSSPYVAAFPPRFATSPLRNLFGALEWLGRIWPLLAAAYALWQVRRRPAAAGAAVPEPPARR